MTIAFLGSILFRDLKPHNVGINSFGIVKIFDFGLAKELKPCDQLGPDLYKANRMSGTRRYMASEVFYGSQYGLPADIYSFTVLLWEVMSLHTPYSGMNIHEHEMFAYKQKRRPQMKRSWPKPIKVLIKNGWSHNPNRRPKISHFHDEIKAYLKSQNVSINEC